MCVCDCIIIRLPVSVSIISPSLAQSELTSIPAGRGSVSKGRSSSGDGNGRTTVNGGTLESIVALESSSDAICPSTTTTAPAGATTASGGAAVAAGAAATSSEGKEKLLNLLYNKCIQVLYMCVCVCVCHLFSYRCIADVVDLTHTWREKCQDLYRSISLSLFKENYRLLHNYIYICALRHETIIGWHREREREVLQ